MDNTVYIYIAMTGAIFPQCKSVTVEELQKYYRYKAGVPVGQPDVSDELDKMEDFAIRYGLEAHETLTLAELCTPANGVGEGLAHDEVFLTRIEQILWLSSYVIAPCRAAAEEARGRPETENALDGARPCWKIAEPFSAAVTSCQSLATEDKLLDEEEWTRRAIEELDKLRFDGGYTGGDEVFKRDSYISVTPGVSTIRRHYANETQGYSIAPMTLSQIRQKGESYRRHQSEALKRKREVMDDEECIEKVFVSSQRRTWLYNIFNMRKHVIEETARHVLEYVIGTPTRAEAVIEERLAQFMLGGAEAVLEKGFLHKTKWPLDSTTDAIKIVNKVKTSSDAEIRSAYQIVEYYARELCIEQFSPKCDIKQLQEDLYAVGYLHVAAGGPGWEARQILLIELADVFRNCLFPIAFSEDASLADMVEKAIDVKQIDRASGRGPLAAMCYLPAKSILVDGAPCIVDLFQALYSRAAYFSASDAVVAEPANYVILKPDQKKQPAKKKHVSIEKFFAPVSGAAPKQKPLNLPTTFHMYDNLYNQLIDNRERYSGIFVVAGAVTVYTLRNINSPGARCALRNHVHSHTKGSSSPNFVPPKSQPMCVSLSVLESFVALPASKESNISFAEINVVAGDVFVWDNKCPVAIVAKTGAPQAMSIYVELNFYMRADLLESEDRERVNHMLSNHVRSNRVQGLSNSYEWIASHGLVAAWKKKPDVFHPYLMRTEDNVQLYYNHIPWRLLDEIRSVRHYAGVSQTAVFDCK